MKKRTIKLLLAYAGALLVTTVLLSIDGSTNYTKSMHVANVQINTSTGALSDNNNTYTVIFKDDLNGELWKITTNNKYKVNARYNVTLNDNSTDDIYDDIIKAITPYYTNSTITSR